MDHKDDKRNNQGNGIEGVVVKSAGVELSAVTDDKMIKINKHTLEDLSSEDVFTFKVAVCDNEIDRDHEVFTTAALHNMKDLFIGRTIIKDHAHASDNQVARIFDTEVVTHGDTITGNKEPYSQLVAHCYMLKTDQNAGLIAEIKGGIKKEVSVGVSVGKATCSICGVDNAKQYCQHYWGQEYDGEKCYFKLEGITDAYEVSFVAVPAQKRAGVLKNYGAKEKAFEKKDQETPDIEKLLNLRFRLLDQTIQTEKR